jgi:hypothetical protein
MLRPTRLSLEHLEDRCLPATWGNPWPDGTHLTLSFARDGTPTGTQPSELSRLLAGSPTAAWQRAVLRAFQTWAVNANLNVSVVPDGGQPFGTPGSIQGDPRFGDVRIGAQRLDPSQAAFAHPFDVAAGTWAGDVFLNSGYRFGLGQPDAYDLYSVALHEAGHVFGLDDGTDPASPMFGSYLGTRTGLTPGDVAALQALYGPRQPDAYEGQSGNDTTATATPLALFDPHSATPGKTIEADVSTATDQDYYRLRVGPQNGPVTVRLQTSGVSSLLAEVTVFNGAGQVVASASATDPMAGDLAVTFSSTQAADYYVRVRGASGDVFGIGGYRLTAVPAVAAQAAGSAAKLAPTQPNPDNHTNDTLATATVLQRSAALTDSRFDYAYRASIGDPTDVDYYAVQSPNANKLGTNQTLTVMAWGLGGGLDPQVTVYDGQGNPVAANVLVHEGGNYVIQIPGVQPNTRYFFAVSGRGGVGDYFLGLDFGPAATDLQTLAAGTAGTADAGPTPFTVARSGVYHFVLTADAPAELTVVGSDGSVAGTLDAAGNPASLTLFLPAGDYTLRVTPLGGAGPVDYSVGGITLSDPIDPYLLDPTLAPVPPPAPTPPPTGSSSITLSGPAPVAPTYAYPTPPAYAYSYPGYTSYSYAYPSSAPSPRVMNPYGSGSLGYSPWLGPLNPTYGSPLYY